ncbi:MAG: efflux RND transporter periplasmic adaptor subunit [Bacteroidota bacterium]|jgi:multidrug efflux pump subunit AcrA (membrane-fusion protein)
MTRLSIVLLLIAGLIQSCTKESAQEAEPGIVVDVRVASIRTGSIDETVSASGSTTNLRESQLRSPIAGVITKFKLFNGDAVAAGETVAVVQTKESQASIQGAERLVRSATNPAQREEAEKALGLARDAANNAIITAPFSGIVSSKAKNEMELVSEEEPIVSLVDPQSIVFIADVPSRSLPMIGKGQNVLVRFPTIAAKVFHGTVGRIEPLVNPGDQTAHVQINFSEPTPTLQRSLFGDATVVVGKRSNVLLAPAAALLHNDENNTTEIVVVGKDSVAHKVDVQVGIRQDSLVQIMSKSVSAGDLVVVQGHYGLPDSTRVRIVQ